MKYMRSIVAAFALVMACLLSTTATAALKQYQYQAVDLHSNHPLPGAKVTIYNFGTTTRATIYDDAGVARSNPITADDNGIVSFKASDTGSYQAIWSLNDYVSPLWSLTSNGAIPAIVLGDFSLTACETPPTFSVGGTIANPTINVTMPFCSFTGGLSYRGTWNANTNSPTITSGSCTAGYFYVVATPGTTTINGISFWNTGDEIICSGSNWQRLPYPALSSEYGTKTSFVSYLASASGVSAGAIARVRSVATPGVGYGTCGLTYVAAESSTGVYGEVNGAGLYWQPQYSSNPVETCEFGAIGDASFSNAGASFTATANGTSTLTVSSTTGLTAGMLCSSVRWHSDASAKLPSAATLVSVGASTITLSTTVSSGSNILLACWNPLTNSTVSGTDSCAALHGAMDYALVNNYGTVHLAGGFYKLVACGLDINYGLAFKTLNVVADAGDYNGSTAGAAIYCLDTTRPCVSFQGVRDSVLQNVMLIGPNWTYGEYAATYANYGATYSVVPSSDPLDWLAPNLVASGATPGGLQTNSPLAGVAVDPRSGSAPAAPYGNVTFPSGLYTGSPPAQYGKLLSSHAHVVGGGVAGFGVQYVSGVNTENQGDFFTIDDASLGMGPYGVVIANSQSRNTMMTNHRPLGLHTVYSGTVLGVGHGSWNSTILNASGTTFYQWLDFQGLGYVGPLVLQNSYCEICVRIGNFVGTSSWSGALTILGGQMSTGEDWTRTRPASYLTVGSNQHVIIDGGFQLVAAAKGLVTLVTGGAETVDIRAASLRGASFYTGGSAAIARAIDYTGGVPIGSPNTNLVGVRRASFGTVFGAACNSDGTDCTNSRIHSDELKFKTASGLLARDYVTQATTGMVDQFGKRWRFELPTNGIIDPTSATYVSATASWSSCDVMTFTEKSSYYNLAFYKLAPGWLLEDWATGTNFVVTAVGAADGSGNYPITTKQMNNMTVDVNGACVSSVHPTFSGSYLIIIPTGVMAWRQVEFGTFTSGSTNVTSVSRGDGYCGDLGTYIANGDALWGSAMHDGTYSPWFVGDNGANSIAGFNTGTCTVTLGANSAYSGRLPITPYPVH